MTDDTPLANTPVQEEENELYEHHRIVVDKGQAMLRLDKYLQMRLEGISRNKIQTAVKAGCVLVNNVLAKSNYKVKPCDVITVLLPEPPHDFEVLRLVSLIISRFTLSAFSIIPLHSGPILSRQLPCAGCGQ